MFERINLQTEQQQQLLEKGFPYPGPADMRERKTMIQELQRKRKSLDSSVKTIQKLYTSAPACPHVTKLAAKVISPAVKLSQDLFLTSSWSTKWQLDCA